MHLTAVTEWGPAVALLDKPLWESPWKLRSKRMINAAPSPKNTQKLKVVHRIITFPFCVTTTRLKVCNNMSVTIFLQDFLKENTEHMRPEVVSLLRSSGRAFLHQLVASSPEALFRWGVLRATIRILSVFKNMGRQRAELCRSQKLLIPAAISDDSLLTPY